MSDSKQRSKRSGGASGPAIAGHPLTLVQRYEQIHNVFRWAHEASAYFMISNRPKTSAALKAFQVRLRSEFLVKFPGLALNQLSDRASSVMAKANQISDLSSTAIDLKAYNNFSFWSCVQACSLVSAMIGNIPFLGVTTKDRTRLHGLLDAEALTCSACG